MSGLRKFARFAVASLFVGTPSVWAQTPAPAEPPASCSSVAPEESTSAADCDSVFACPMGDLWTRETLLGDPGGFRSAAQESGITFAGKTTHFAFGVEGGVGSSPVPLLSPGDTFKYTGRNEYDLLFDLEKFGGLPHGKLLVRAEHWYGEYGNVSLNTGAFSPAVFPAALPPTPENEGMPYLSNFIVTQPLSEKFIVFAGKKDVLGAADQDEFAGGDGTDQFVNQALIANPAFLLGLPYTSFTAGAAMPQDWGMISTFVYDPRDRTRDVLRMDDLFRTGVIVGGEVKVNTNFFGKPGDQHVGGMWKHVAMTDLSFSEPPPSAYPYPQVPGFATRDNAYTLYYGFDQYLVTYANNPKRGFGLFGRASISDGNPTPLRYFLSAGVGGFSPIGQERGDTFGIGWYYVGASDQFGPLPTAVFGPRDGTGVELYYNIQVTPWLNITPDMQYIHPEAGAIADDAYVYGFRTNAKF